MVAATDASVMDRHSYPPTVAAERGCNAIVHITLTSVVTHLRGWWYFSTQCQELHVNTRRGLGHDAFDQTAHPSIEPLGMEPVGVADPCPGNAAWPCRSPRRSMPPDATARRSCCA